MKQKFAFLLLAIATATLIYSCGGRSENRKIKEAAAIHEKMMIKHDSIYAALENQRTKVKSKMDQIGDANQDYPAYKSMYRSIDRGFGLLNSWNESVVSVPGIEHAHKEGAAHDHDHSNDKTLKNMKDQEILDLQKAYSNRLDEVSLKIKELITTMDMYTKDAA